MYLLFAAHDEKGSSGAAEERFKERVETDDDDDRSLADELRTVLGPWGPVAIAGVAVYVAVTCYLWESFMAYFRWSESLAITIQVPMNLSYFEPVISTLHLAFVLR